jgi:hypothetical protein
MSMSEFENLHESDDDLPMQHQTIPDDFSEDDIEFAQELGALFSLKRRRCHPLLFKRC